MGRDWQRRRRLRLLLGRRCWRHVLAVCSRVYWVTSIRFLFFFPSLLSEKNSAKLILFFFFFLILLVTPLDVVRVRLQSQHPPPSSSSTLSNKSAIPQLSTTPLRAAAHSKLPLSPLQFRTAAHLSTPELGVTACCREVFWVNNTTEACLAATAPGSASNILNDSTSCAVEETSRRRIHGTWEGLVKIARYEGASSLWRGLSPTLLMAVPSNVIYFTGYDTLRTSELSPFSHSGVFWGPLLAGSSARAIAATAISPIEMFRTRLQAISAHADAIPPEGVFRTTLRGLRDMVATDGVHSLWRGLVLTLWRDVPFSGVYWLGYEGVRGILRREREKEWHLSSSLHLLHNHNSNLRGGAGGGAGVSKQRTTIQDLHSESVFVDSFISGAVSGSVAAFLTTPFDVGKTRRQVSAGDPRGSGSMARVLYNIWRTEGVSGLWRGCTPRMLKVAPACAIMVGISPPFGS